MREQMEDLLSPESIDKLNVVNTHAVLSAKEAHMSGKNQLGFELWGLMMLVNWHRIRVQRRPTARTSSSLRRLQIEFDQKLRV
jgi:hypothetical protein